nr:TfoX/Sxy family protein [Antrihabitans stalactiti]
MADRIREIVASERGVDEKRMFGGLAFLIGGNMAVSASGKGGLMVRVDPDSAPELLRAGQVEPMVMRGREMLGWLRVDAEAVQDDADLLTWVNRGIAYAKALPRKS